MLITSPVLNVVALLAILVLFTTVTEDATALAGETGPMIEPANETRLATMPSRSDRLSISNPQY